MRQLPLALAAFACTLALPAAADAAYELGSHPNGVLEGTFTACPAGCTLVQDWNANERMRVPEWLGPQSVVVRWRVRGEGGQARLQRVGLEGATGRGGAGTDPVALTGAIQEIPARLPVRAGEALGLVLTPGARVSSVDLGFGESTLTWEPALTGTARAGVETPGNTLAFQAVVEPDTDADGLGDETQDDCVGSCVVVDPPAGDPPPPPPADPAPPAPAPGDPYAEIRASGPKATLAREATKKGSKVAVTVSNPYAFAINGNLQLKRGKKVVAKAKVKLAANAIRTIQLKVRNPGRSLTAVTTLRGPVGKAQKTTSKLKVTTRKTGTVDGTYRGRTGAGADWVMVIKDGVVTNFNGSISTYCTRAGEQKNHAFAMIADDPDPRVAANGSFAWEATRGYGFDKLKFNGVVKNGIVAGNLVVESRPMVSGTSPVTGMPRIEVEYCFAGRDYTLTK